MKTFAWIKANTPTDAIFALNPEHLKLPVKIIRVSAGWPSAAW